ncbi:MAG: LysR family transcriptional regulator [Rhodovulum sulfidophilum]|uniref:LysR family transcriptional regulator n=1 Tax=Rhodovulum sulfidophilum TaxID=35806 RepID=A0A2W5PZ22_RHOSU|nr:MAG: LysR family transcriptional regulator [Rhodovulum sulfidophilum]
MQLAGTDLRLIRVFDAVVRHRGFPGAQVELNIGQSTISNHITALEQRLGLRLCRRGRAGFRLTDEGAEVHREVTAVLRGLEDFTANVAGLRNEMVGTLRIGLVDAIITDPNCPVAAAFSAFNRRQHAVRFEISEDVPQALQAKVAAGELDLAVGCYPTRIPGLRTIALYIEGNSLYCAAGHPLFTVPDAEIDPLALVRNRAAGRSYWRAGHSGNRTLLHTRAVAKTIEHQLILILTGDYIGYVPDHAARPYVEAGQLRALLPGEFHYPNELALALKDGPLANLAVGTFVDDLLACAGGAR